MDTGHYYTCNGFILHDFTEAPEGGIIIAHPRLLGGKGGFGSMLRAIGSQIEKTTNREMCRDLNGRRMRDVNNEKRLKEWLEGADDRQKEKIEACLEKRRKRKILLEQGPMSRVAFEDSTGSERRQQIADELQEAIEEAFEKRKKTLVKHELKPKIKCKSLGIDSDLESSSSSCSSTKNDENESCSELLEHVNQSHAKENESDLSNEHNSVEGTLNTKDDPSESTCNLEVSIHQSYTLKEDCGSLYIEDSSDIEPFKKKVKVEEESPITMKVTEDKSEFPAIDLDNVGSVLSLLTYDGIWIKNELQRRGLKCGGTLMERAQRLFICKGLDPESYPVSIKAGSTTQRRK